MTDDVPDPYDEVIYPGNPVVQTHPDRLATVARLFGMWPAPASRCRVLELGCGIGGNLMAMAYQWPQSQFVGIDLSRRSIEIGNRNLAELGLKNLALHPFDIMQVTQEFGQFDYIVAHGVYSWVPPAVRERLLAVYKAHLAPQGVAYVSYNAFPGSHLRDVARDLMLFHTRDIDAPREKLEASHQILAFAAQASPQDSVHGRILRDQLKRLERTAQEVIYHDDLEPSATPFLLHEVAEAAGRHGLQYLGDANFGFSQLFGLPDAVVTLIEQIPESRAMEREQYIDFVKGRSFRRTLLVHDDVVLDRAVGPERIRDMFFAGRLVPAEKGIDPLTPGIVAFRTASGRMLQAEHPLAKAALARLGAVWPESIAFADLLEQALALLAQSGAEVGSDAAREAEGLAAFLFRAYASRDVDMHSEPTPVTSTIGERPEASLLARKQIEAGPVITNLRHARVVLEDPIARRFLVLVDGTRTLEALVDDLNAEISTLDVGAKRQEENEQPPAPPVQVTRQQVEDNLRILARLALLVR